MSRAMLNGEIFHDDRMFVLYLCKCTVAPFEGLENVTIYHEETPENFKWCLATYRNVDRYPIYRTDEFDSEAEAIEYAKHIEPQTPLVSLGGNSPNPPMSYTDFLDWKKENEFEEYDYRKVFTPGGSNPQESVMRRPR